MVMCRFYTWFPVWWTSTCIPAFASTRTLYMRFFDLIWTGSSLLPCLLIRLSYFWFLYIYTYISIMVLTAMISIPYIYISMYLTTTYIYIYGWTYYYAFVAIVLIIYVYESVFCDCFDYIYVWSVCCLCFDYIYMHTWVCSHSFNHICIWTNLLPLFGLYIHILWISLLPFVSIMYVSIPMIELIAIIVLIYIDVCVSLPHSCCHMCTYMSMSSLSCFWYCPCLYICSLPSWSHIYPCVYTMFTAMLFFIVYVSIHMLKSLLPCFWSCAYRYMLSSLLSSLF